MASLPSRTKEFLAHEDRVAAGTNASPPLTPLSQFSYHESDEEYDHEQEQSFAQQQQDSYLKNSAIHEMPPPSSSLDPLDQLFAGLSQPQPPSFSAAQNSGFSPSVPPQAHQPASLPNGNFNLLQTILPGAFPQSSTPPPSQPLPPARSLLDDIFASAALGASATSNPAFHSNLGPLAAAFQQPPPPPPPVEPLPVTPPQTAMNTAQAAQRFSGPFHDDDDDDIVFVPNGNGNANGNMNNHRDQANNEPAQEVQPPSPSLIPNPLHTPLPAPSIRQGKARNRRKNNPNGAANRTTIATSNGGVPGLTGRLPPLRESAMAQGFRTKQQYIPQNTNEETQLDVNAITETLLEARLEANGQSNGEVLSKYDFMSELLTLIHVSVSYLLFCVSAL